MKNMICKRMLAAVIAGVLVVGSAMPVIAEEQTQEQAEEEAAEGAEGENEEGAEGQDGEQGEEQEGESEGGSVVMSALESNNGRYIASAFPEDLLPEGFHKSNCTYSGEKIDIARMDNDDSGEIVLAYLADEDGGNGDFYLCDINTADMTDFVQIKNGNDGFIVVLDPGDVVVAPGGFTRARLEWYGGKSVTAWLLPDANAGEKSALGDTFFHNVKVYALAGEATATDVFGDDESGDEEDEAQAGDEAGAGEETKEEQKQEEDKAESDGEKEKSDEKPAASKAGEDGSGVVYADPSEFFMVYAIDNTGTVGFYIYDKVQKTYQRYVANSSADADTVAQYKKSAQIRLYIIVGLAFVMLILLFVLVNMIISKKDDDGDYEADDEDEGDDYEEAGSRRRAAVDNGRSSGYDHDPFEEKRNAFNNGRRPRALDPDYADYGMEPSRSEEKLSGKRPSERREMPAERRDMKRMMGIGEGEYPAYDDMGADEQYNRPVEREAAPAPAVREERADQDRAVRAENARVNTMQTGDERRPIRRRASVSGAAGSEGQGGAGMDRPVRQAPAGGAQPGRPIRRTAQGRPGMPAAGPEQGAGVRRAPSRPVRKLNPEAPRGSGKDRFDEDFDFEFINLD